VRSKGGLCRKKDPSVNGDAILPKKKKKKKKTQKKKKKLIEGGWKENL